MRGTPRKIDGSFPCSGMRRPGVASRRAQRPTVHGERSKRRRDGRRRGELTGSQQVTASPSFYYLLSLLRSSGYPLPFPQPPSTSAISRSPPSSLSVCLSVSLLSRYLHPILACVYFRLASIAPDGLFVRRAAKRSVRSSTVPMHPE